MAVIFPRMESDFYTLRRHLICAYTVFTGIYNSGRVRAFLRLSDCWEDLRNKKYIYIHIYSMVNDTIIEITYFSRLLFDNRNCVDIFVFGLMNYAYILIDTD